MKTTSLARPLGHVLAALAVATSCLVAMAAPADAAPAPRVTIDRTVGTDRVVAVTLTCTSARPCAGKVTLKLASGGTKTRGYQVARKSSKTLRWSLSARQYRALTKAGKARLTVVGKAKRPTSRTFRASAVLRPAKPQVGLRTKNYRLGDDHRLTLAYRCSAPAGCAGRFSVVVRGKVAATAAYRTTKGDRLATIALPHAAVAELGTTPTAQRVVVTETSPDRIAQSVAITLAITAPTPKPTEPTAPPARQESVDFATRKWTPTAHDTCPAALHDAYRTIGPDGKIYPTWHPPQVVDPATGTLCSFGHEHGADPRTSDIYAWVSGFYSPDDLAADEPTGLPFGYASEQLEEYGRHHAGMTMRHEDNAGQKVFVANDVTMLDADRNYIRTTDALGASVKVQCDFLIKQHQGSHSADATSNNAHEMLFATRCNDGTEVLTTLMARFGDPNELFSPCDEDTPVTTVGSTLPQGTGGKRIIPTSECVAEYATGSNANLWALYEVWQSDVQVTDADGDVLAHFDPWFGVRNPSRYYDAATSTATSNAILRPVQLAWLQENPATAYPWSTITGEQPFDWRDPRSPFNGAQRDFYLSQLRLAPTSTGRVYTDPYGESASSTPFPGSLPQVLVRGSALGDVPLDRQKFDTNADFAVGTSVHAPG